MTKKKQLKEYDDMERVIDAGAQLVKALLPFAMKQPEKPKRSNKEKAKPVSSKKTTAKLSKNIVPMIKPATQSNSATVA